MLVKLDHFPQSSGWKFKQKNNWNQHLVFSTESFLKIHELDHPSFYKGAAAVASDIWVYIDRPDFRRQKKREKHPQNRKQLILCWRMRNPQFPSFWGGSLFTGGLQKKTLEVLGWNHRFLIAWELRVSPLFIGWGWQHLPSLEVYHFFQKWWQTRDDFQCKNTQHKKAQPSLLFFIHFFSEICRPSLEQNKKHRLNPSFVADACFFLFFMNFPLTGFCVRHIDGRKNIEMLKILESIFFFHEKCSQNAPAVSFFCWQTANNLTCSLFRVSFE